MPLLEGLFLLLNPVSLIYLVLGVAWAIPFKFIFKGVGKDDPNV